MKSAVKSREAASKRNNESRNDDNRDDENNDGDGELIPFVQRVGVGVGCRSSARVAICHISARLLFFVIVQFDGCILSTLDGWLCGGQAVECSLFTEQAISELSQIGNPFPALGDETPQVHIGEDNIFQQENRYVFVEIRPQVHSNDEKRRVDYEKVNHPEDELRGGKGR